MVGLVLPFWVNEFENTVTVLAGVYFASVQAFIAPFVFLFNMIMG
jgi:hypothetical protein